jgi:hypothetical protein
MPPNGSLSVPSIYSNIYFINQAVLTTVILSGLGFLGSFQIKYFTSSGYFVPISIKPAPVNSYTKRI